MLLEHKAMVFQVHRIGCVWETPFCKSSHILFVYKLVGSLLQYLKYITLVWAFKGATQGLTGLLPEQYHGNAVCSWI